MLTKEGGKGLLETFFSEIETINLRSTVSI